MISIRAYGDSAVLVNFEQKIDATIHAQVTDLANRLELAVIGGIKFLIPAYCSITIGYDPLVIDYHELCRQVRVLAAAGRSEPSGNPPRSLRIPVCYKKPFAADLEEVTAQTGISPEEVVRIHTRTTFRVYMLGFLPGFVYLGTLPEELFCTRKITPRLKVSGLSVGLAGLQTGIYPFEAPGGWQIIGRTPFPTFEPRATQPFLFRAGDQVDFYAISANEYQRMEKDIASGTFTREHIYG